MTEDDKPQFLALMKGVYSYHRQPLTEMLLAIYWRGCRRWSLEDVSLAVDVLTADPEAGKFVPKIGDIARVLEGTHGDRSALAWGKVYESISRVGAHVSVVFDDAAIHAAIDDLGGWPKVCRTPIDELGYVQTAFSKSYRAYVGRGTFNYPPKLLGETDCADVLWLRKGLQPPQPALVGDPARCRAVFEGGSAGGRVAISLQPVAALLPASTNDSNYRRIA